MDEETDFIRLPLEERCVHKNWKARVHGYEEATKLFQKIDDERSPEWNKYLGLIKKFASDSNVAAQEKGLEATLAYIENAFVATKTAGEVMPIIVTKCIGATKAKIKDLATQISLMYIEIEKQDVVLDELFKGTEHKNPKISAACVNTIAQALREFGFKVIDIKSILKKLASLLEDRDKNVRDEAKMLTVELFKWFSNQEVIRTHLKSLKPIQLQELESEFEKVKSEKPVVQRYLKSQQAKQSKLAEVVDNEVDTEDSPDNDDANEIDPLDLIPAVDVLSKLPNDFYDKLEEKKWQDRKESLDKIEELLCNAPKVETGDYGDLIRGIKKVITKDSNVILVGIAAKCMAMLAKGLKKKFQPYASQCLLPLLEKFKEKKQNVVLPLRDAVDAIYDSTTIEAVQEDVVSAMESKNPAVKVETIDFLARCFTKCNSLMLNKKLLKVFMTALLKTLNDSDPVVRDNTAKAIGTAWKVVGEKVISTFIKDILEDSTKITKIKNEAEDAVIIAKLPKAVKKAPIPDSVAEKSKAGSVNPKPVRRPVSKTATFVKKSSSTTSLNKKPALNTRPKSVVNGNDEEDLSDEDNERPDTQDLVARVDISSKITQNIIGELSHKDWKVKTEAINKFQLLLNDAKYITNNLGEAVPVIIERLTDKHERVAAASFVLCESIGVAMGPSCKTLVREFFPAMLQGLRDKKRSAAAIKCINTWGSIAGYKEFFENEMIASALKAESPVLRIELWKWLAEKLPEMRNVPKDELTACLPRLYEHLVGGNLEVRKNATEAIHGFMIHLRYQTMFQACEKLKPVDCNTIKGFLDRARGNLPDLPAPKFSKPGSAPSSSSQIVAAKPRASVAKSKAKIVVPVKKRPDEDMDASALLKFNPTLKVQRGVDENKLKVLRWNFSVPREEFVEQLKEQMNTAGVNKTLITNMFHINFKFHLKAIDCLSEDLESNLAALTSNLDLVLKWLTIRFFDTNPSVILRGLEYLTSVFHLLAEEGYNMTENEATSFLPYLVLKIGDPKDTVRSHVRDIFDAVGSVYPISKLFIFVMDGIKSKNARQRTGCLDQLGSLIENYGLSVCQPSPASALKEIAKQISDRDNSVRNAALNCVVSAYFIAGDKIRQMIGQISDKDMSLLDERIKRALKNRTVTIPVATVKPTVCSPVKRIMHIEPSSQQLNNMYNYHSEDEMPADEDMYQNNEEYVEEIPETILSPPKSNQTKQRRFGLDSRIMESIESIQIVHPIASLDEYDQNYFTETITRIPRMQQPASCNYSYNTQTVVKSRPSPPKVNTIESLISNIGTSTDFNEVMESMIQLDSVLEDEDKRKELNGLETELILQVIKFLMLLNNLNDMEDSILENRYTCAVLLLKKLFLCQTYPLRIPISCLKQLLIHLIKLLVDKNSEDEKWKTLNKVINNLVLKILERSEHTIVICALLQMLYDSVASNNTEKPHQHLIMNCIWKTIKYIPKWDPDIDYDKVLCEVDRFFSCYPSTWWKKQPDDTPMRTCKTMVHAIVKIQGADVLNTAYCIPGFNEQCELYHYINRLLKHITQEEKTDDAPDKAKYHIPRMQRDELAQILKKIGRKEESEQGLRMLYEFKKNYPEVNVNQFLTKTSTYFQNYVAKGLENVQAEEEDKYKCSNGTLGTNENNISSVENGSGESLESDAQRYQQKLKILQMRAGWDQHKKASSASCTNTEPASNLIPALRISSPSQRLADADGDSSVTLEQIRHKLSQLRGGN